MRTPIEVYGLCRCFVLDRRSILGEDLSNKVLGYVRSRDLAKLANLSKVIGPELYSSPVLLATVLQIEAFFKKNALFSEEDTCFKQAQKNFELAERRCRITNKRLDFYYAQPGRLDPDLSFWMSRAERYVERLLGDFASFEEQIPKLIKITSGASATRSRAQSLRPFKVSKRPHASSRAQVYLQALSNHFGYGPLRVRPTHENRVEVVRKNWLTHRTIACEPEGNLTLQLAFDTFVKSRLRKRGQDLSDQTRNQRMAYQASLDCEFATLDLEMASDLLSLNTVAWLLPEPWYNYLASIRSPFYRGKFGEGKYAKFSSMGNGATFSLETLIFCSCCYAVGSKSFSVYGDDIIIEAAHVNDLIRLLKFIGFPVNTGKSHFGEVPFRESCGKHYLGGVEVTPKYLRDGGRNKQILCHNVNALASIADPDGRLVSALLDIIAEERLLIVPFSEMSIEGVWVDIHTAYKLGLLRSQGGILRRKRYVPAINRKSTISIYDSRSLFLWYLAKYQERDVIDPVRTSAYSPLHLKYRCKVGAWHPPGVATPDHLYWWSDEIVRSLNKS